MSNRQSVQDGTGIIESIPGFGIVQAAGTAVPSDGTLGYATGCIFHHLDGSVGGVLYVNGGSKSSADFNVVESLDATVTKTFGIALTDLRKSGAIKDALGDSPDATDLGLADAAGSPVVSTTTNGGATASATEKCSFDYVVPADYVVGEDLTVRIAALITAARGTSATLDLVAKLVKGGALDSTDLCATAAIDMNAVTAEADQDFTITGDSSGDELAAGSIIHFEIALATDDTTATANGYGKINAISVLVPCYR